MKRLIGLFILLFLLIPTSVQASGVFDFVSMVLPKNDSFTKQAGFRTSRNDSVIADSRFHNKDLLCEVGYKLDYGSLIDSGQARMTCNKVIIPSNAQLSGTGDDFQCDRDFKRNGDLCEKLMLPANAHIAAGGNDFDCNTGYTKDGDKQSLASGDAKCIDAHKPANAKFFPQSDDWYCENGYVQNGDKCESLKVPSNGRASETGTFFYCLPGHKLAENKIDCEQIKVPENAQPNWLGSWDCNQGYRKDNDRCEKVELPSNAKFLLRGADFYCDAQYKKNEADRTCVKVVLPENASWDDASYGQWRCKQGYVRKDDNCEVFKLPEHAFWVGFNSWDCDAGYVKVGYSRQGTDYRCNKVSIPEHAHISDSWEKWDCDSEYTKNYTEKRCDKI